MFIGYGRSAEVIVKSILADSETPLHFREIAETASRMAKEESGRGLSVAACHFAAEKVGFLFSRGTYGLRRHLGLSDAQMADILGAAEGIVLSLPERQWHTSEVLAELQRRSSGGLGIVDKYALDIVLAGSKRVASLGRMAWTAAGTAVNRIDIRREVVAIVEEAGHPLSEEEITERLKSRRGLNETYHIVPHASLVPLQKGLWGLNDRDVPVKRGRQLELIESLVGRLEARQSGISEGELPELLMLDGCPPRTFAAIAAQDSRLKKDHRRCLYLAKWGGPRRPVG